MKDYIKETIIQMKKRREDLERELKRVNEAIKGLTEVYK